jgi:HEAT repeat protein
LSVALKSDEVEVRRAAAEALSDPRTAEKKMQAAWPAAVAAIKDPDAEVRAGIVPAVRQFAPDADAATARLKPMLADEDDRVRIVAAFALAELEAPDVAPTVVELLVNKPGKYQKELIDVLAQFGPQAAVAAPLLTEMLGKSPTIPEEERQSLEYSLVRALGRTGPAAKGALPELVKRFKQREPGDREELVEALAQIGPAAPAEVAPALLAAIEEDPDWVRRVAAKGLAAMSADPAQVKEPLLKLLGDKDIEVREFAAGGLGHLGTASATDVVPALIAALTTEEAAGPRSQILLAIVEYGDAAQAAGPAMIAGFFDAKWNYEERVLAAQSLAKVVPKSPAAVAALRKQAAAELGNVELRVAAIRALADFAPLPPEIIAELQKLVADDEPLRAAAQETLDKVRPRK